MTCRSLSLVSLPARRPHQQQDHNASLSQWSLAFAAFALSTTASTAFCWTSSFPRPWGWQRRCHSLQNRRNVAPQRRLGQTTLLWDGYGVATNYSWKEDDFEVEISARVPANTTSSQIKFRAMTKSIDLRLCSGDEEIVLLDGSREMRGMIQADGTFWTFGSEDHDGNEENDKEYTQIVVTMEKLLKNRMDSTEVHLNEWKGIYRTEEPGEVLERHYEEPEEMDIREYASSLGVDIDNIDMSKVDKTMFTSKMNMTRSTFDALHKAGMLEEVTQQASQEFLQDELGNAVPRSPPENAWFADSVPVEEVMDRDALAQAADAMKSTATSPSAIPRRRPPIEAINILTVARLKELLREEGLKVSGKKKELQDRLRQHWMSQRVEGGGGQEEEEEELTKEGAWE